MNLAELFSHETDFLALPAGQILFKTGEQGDVMYVLMSGKAEIIVKNTVVEVVEPGAILGEVAMVDNSLRSASVIALTDCSLLPIDRERFNFLIQQTPNFALHVMRVMAGRLRHTGDLLQR